MNRQELELIIEDTPEAKDLAEKVIILIEMGVTKGLFTVSKRGTVNGGLTPSKLYSAYYKLSETLRAIDSDYYRKTQTKIQELYC